MNDFLTRYRPAYLKTLIYMLQASEYKMGDYVSWLGRTKNFDTVAKRRGLAYTAKAKLLLLSLVIFTGILVVVFLWLMSAAVGQQNVIYGLIAVLLLVLAPFLLAYGIAVPLVIGEVFIQRPKTRLLVAEATNKLAHNSATRIGIAGSFGKTTFKETLQTILSEGLKVAATPGNMNTVIGTSMFVKRLTGTEDVILFELGESHVGDVAELAHITRPEIGVITGINQAHLTTFKTIERTTATIFELQDYLGKLPLYKNAESELVAGRIKDGDPLAYSRQGVNGWKISDVKIGIEGTRFEASKKGKTVWVKSQLLGAHQIGPLVACIDIADRLGLSVHQIAAGIQNTKAFEHRMEPRQLNGAWIIDDTYNGNIQGVEAGLEFLAATKAKRKIYVTPGLVEQGSETQAVHEKLGELAADVADVVVLMRNSVTQHIEAGLERKGFKGEVLLISEPLKFYENLDQFIAAGDIVLMQNDWTDNYA